MIFTVFLLALIGIFIFQATKGSLSTKSVDSPNVLDLSSVREAVMEKQGWSRERADAAQVEYLRFLTLLQMQPGFMLVPWTTPDGKDDLDQFWHQHILDTAKYSADCERLFGRMIHHNPHVVRGSGQETDAVEKTQRLYARTFGSGSYGRPVESSFLTGCGACATADSLISTDGGHSHSSHSDSGHSCGGHSCGHGCGHGCGGH